MSAASADVTVELSIRADGGLAGIPRAGSLTLWHP